MDDLHPYDGRDRRFSDSDSDPAALARGRKLVASLLRLAAPPAIAGLRYDLLFTSGGSGVFDRLHIALPCAPAEAEEIAARAGFLAIDAPWEQADRDDLEWLVQDEDRPERSLAEHAAAFVANERKEFQRPVGAGLRVWFTPGSDVNSWSLLYAADGELAYIAQDQG